MFFNPLFLNITNSDQSPARLNVNKMNGASYLFSDIIKVCIDKTEIVQESIKPNLVEKTQGYSTTNFIENLFKDQINLRNLPASPDAVQKEEITKLIDNSPVQLQKYELHRIIRDLLQAGQGFEGNITLLIDKEQFPANEVSLEKLKGSPEELIALLKNGGTLLIEDPELAKDNGLLITLIEKEDSSINDEITDTSVFTGQDEKQTSSSAEYEIKIAQISVSNVINSQEIAADLYSGSKINIVLNNNPQKYTASLNLVNELPPFMQPGGNAHKKLYSNGQPGIQNEVAPDDGIVSNQESASNIKQVFITPPDTHESNYSSVGDIEINTPSPISSNSSTEMPNYKSINNSTETPNNQTINNSTTRIIEKIYQVKKEISKPEISLSGKIGDKNISDLNLNATNPFKEGNKETKDLRIIENNIIKNEPVPIASPDLKISDKLNKTNLTIPAIEPLPDNNTEETIEPAEKTKDLIKTDKLRSAEAEIKIIPSKEIKIHIKPEEKSEKLTENNKANNAAEPLKVEHRIILPLDKTEPEKDLFQNIDVIKHSIKINDLKRPLSMKEVISNGIKELHQDKPQSDPNLRPQISDSVKPVEQDSDLLPKDSKEQSKNSFNNYISQASNKQEFINNIPEQKTLVNKDPHINEEKVTAIENQTAQAKDVKLGDDEPTNSENKNALKKHTDPLFRTETQVIQKDKPVFEIPHQQIPSKIIKAAEVVKELTKFIQDGTKNSIVMKIDPENLGSMKIQLEVVNKMINAQIEVDNETTQKLVENNLNQLYNSLSQNGVQINSLNISLSNFDQKNTKNLYTRKRTHEGEDKKIIEDKSIIQEKNMGYNTYDYLI